MRPLWIVALCIAGCTQAPTNPIHRALEHRSVAGERLTGPGAGELAEGLDLTVADDAQWVITQGGAAANPRWYNRYTPPEELAGYLAIATDGERVLWRRGDALQAIEVSVTEVPDDATPIDTPLVRGWSQHGPAEPGGELVAEVFLIPPRALPFDTCVELDVAGVALDAGRLVGGRAALHPGARRRPLLRHRLDVDLPDGAGDTAEVRLVDCGTGSTAYRAEVPLVLGGGRPSLADRRARTGTPDDDAKLIVPWGRAVIRRGAEGTKTEPGPPLLRVLKGDAWPLLVGGRADLGVFQRDADAGALALMGIEPLLSEAPAVWVSLDAPLTSAGSFAQPRGAWPVRAAPSLLASLRQAGVTGVVLGLGGSAATGPNGLADMARQAGVAGLQVAGPAPAAQTIGGEDDAVEFAIVALDAREGLDLPALREVLSAARAHAQVVLVAVDPPPQADRSTLGGQVVQAGADGVWLHGPGLGPVEIIDGVPVVHSLPPFIDGSAGPTQLLRVYVNARGVHRLDVLSISRGTSFERVRDSSVKATYEALAVASRPYGTDVRVGESIVAVDVAQHWPPRDERPRTGLNPVELERGEVSWQRPSFCGPAAEVEGVPMGESLTLGWTLPTESLHPGQGSPLELNWRHVGAGALENGALELAIMPSSPPWRLAHVPCEGVWGFDRWAPGDSMRDTLWLVPPEGIEPGEYKMSAALRLGGELQRPESGERRIQLGTVRVER